MKLRYASAVLAAAVLWLTFGPLVRSATAADPCFNMGVTYMGREAVGTTCDGQALYRWHYRVLGEPCINRGVSHWVLALCSNYWPCVSEISTLSEDSSDPPDGLQTFYSPAVGMDPTTGVAGVKWNYSTGNQIDKNGEYDDFSFVSPGSENLVTVSWAGKGGQLVEYGTTTGPSCDPVPVGRVSWGRVKTLYR